MVSCCKRKPWMGCGTETAGVNDHLKKLVETRTKELKQLQDKYTAVAQTGDEMQKTLLNLHQEVCSGTSLLSRSSWAPCQPV